MAVTADFDFKMQAIATPDMDQDLATDPTITHEIKGDTGTLTGSSASPPITKKYADQVLLVAGAKTLDLTALDDGNLPDITFLGLKVQFIKIRALITNAAPVTIKKGATDGYAIFGGTAPEKTLAKGDIEMSMFNDSLADVSGSLKNIDLVGTGTDGIEIILMAG